HLLDPGSHVKRDLPDAVGVDGALGGFRRAHVRQGFPERGAVPGVSVVRTPYLIEVLCDWIHASVPVFEVAGHRVPDRGGSHGSGGSVWIRHPRAAAGWKRRFRPPSSTHEPTSG